MSSFNSQPPEGGWPLKRHLNVLPLSFNSQPPEGGWFPYMRYAFAGNQFQLTAARRRLAGDTSAGGINQNVSTHSRPKAAGYGRHHPYQTGTGFNSQPPEGGWCGNSGRCKNRHRFNSQPPEGGWMIYLFTGNMGTGFQLTAARRRLDKPRCCHDS